MKMDMSSLTAEAFKLETGEAIRSRSGSGRSRSLDSKLNWYTQYGFGTNIALPAVCGFYFHYLWSQLPADID